MTLPYDIARCDGRITNRASAAGPIAAALFPDNVGHSECIDCRRRIPGWPNDHLLTHMEPPAFVGGKCPMRIEP